MFYSSAVSSLSPRIFFDNVFVTEEVICPFQPFTVSRFDVRNTPMFFPHSIYLAFMDLIDLMHGGFVLELHFCFFLCNICHGALFIPIKPQQIVYS